MNKALKILENCRERGQKRAGGLDIDEAISELEALQQQNCGNCTHSFYWESADILECTKIIKQRCYQCEEDLDMTEVTEDFYCNRYEKKEKL